MKRQMLIIMNGTIGVGKSEIAKHLASEITSAVWIEGDSLGLVSPANDIVLKAALDLISAHLKNRVSVVVFDMFFENSEKLEWFISKVGLESYVFYLAADEDELSYRIRKRGRIRAEAEIIDSKRMQQCQQKMKNRGLEIDTNGKSAEEIVTYVKKLILEKKFNKSL